MIEHIPAMISADITSLKIEGRMKGIHYLATTVNVYRQAIDSYCTDPANYRVKTNWIKELTALNHRGYSTGFYFGEPEQQPSKVENHNSAPKPLFVGKVIKSQSAHNISVEVRNKICRGDSIEVLHPGNPARPDQILDIIDSDQRSLPVAQPGNQVRLSLHHDYSPNDLIRKISAKP